MSSYNRGMVLAGDVGGTKTQLGVYSADAPRPRPIETREFQTLEFDSLPQMLERFLREIGQAPPPIDAACFGVAGPVVGNAAHLTNVPWGVDGDQVARRFGWPRVTLLNDLQAMAYAVPALDASEVAVLQEGRAVATGNVALIAAGTGLGEALLHNVNGRLIPSPSEGGHADFAARTPREIALLQALARRFGRVHCEHVISGPGLVNIYRVLHPNGCAVWDPAITPDDEAPAVISQGGLEKRCPACVEALDLLVSAYGAETGNLGLRSVATGGVYVGGGIAPKILPALTAGGFMQAFRDKQPMDDLMAAMPVKVILNRRAGLLGAAVYAVRQG